MFPGQSSADAGMISRALAMHPAAQAVASAAEEVMGGQSARYLGSPAVPLETNQDVQISLFISTQMHLAALTAAGIDAEQSVGLSLGEYSHLVHIGALSFAEALRLVMARGALYNTARPGVMLTVIGADEEAVTAVIGQAAGRGTVAISNFNTPSQHVIAGERDAVAWAASQLEESEGAATVLIEERVPMHSPMLADIAEQFRPALAAAGWRAPVRPYRPNVLGTMVPAPTAADLQSLLAAHVSQPVLWRRAIEHLVAEHPDATFVEVGPGRVLHNMLGRRWVAPRRACTDSGERPPATHFTSLVAALCA